MSLEQRHRGAHVALLFPPATDPRNPHLAMPSLAAALRSAGVRVTMRDLDLEVLLWLLESSQLEARVRAAVDGLRQNDADRWPDAWRLRNLLSDPDRLVNVAARAPAVLRDSRAFFEPHAYRLAREAISGALDVISFASGDIRYNVSPVRYDVRGRDPARLTDLLAVTADPLVDFFSEFWSTRVLGDLAGDRPDVVGVCILNYQQVVPGLTLARHLKRAGHFVVVGGTVFAKFVDRLLTSPAFFTEFCDGVVVYEGETSLLALVDAVTSSGDLSSVPNLVALDPAGRPRLGPHHLEDVNSLPTPDFDGLPLSDYLAPALVLPLLMGKGCYFNKCKFCDIPYINRTSRKSYRIRRADRVAADMAELHRRHGARHFEITDEALAPRLLLRLADALDDHPDVDARFTGFARFESGFTPPVCHRLHDAGLRKLFFGLESGNQATLDHMHKGIRVDTARQILANCREAGIAFHIFSMIGFPEETPVMARETVEFFVRNRELIDAAHNSFDIHRFSLDLRTEYGEFPERFGLHVDSDAERGRDFPVSAARWTSERGMTGPEIERMLGTFTAELRQSFRSFHAYPLHMWPDWATYSVLYADEYADRPFNHRIALPPDDDPIPLKLAWNEMRLESVHGGQRVSGITGEGIASDAAIQALLRDRPAMPVADLLDAVAEEIGLSARLPVQLRNELRVLIDGLLMIGALRCEAEPPMVAGPFPAGMLSVS